MGICTFSQKMTSFCQSKNFRIKYSFIYKVPRPGNRRQRSDLCDLRG